MGARSSSPQLPLQNTRPLIVNSGPFVKPFFMATSSAGSAAWQGAPNPITAVVTNRRIAQHQLRDLQLNMPSALRASSMRAFRQACVLNTGEARSYALGSFNGRGTRTFGPAQTT